MSPREPIPSDPRDPAIDAQDGADSPCTGDAKDFLAALLSVDRIQALQIAKLAAQRGRSVADIHVKIIKPAMVQIGTLWAKGRISVAAEHSATAIAQYVVMALYPLIDTSALARGAAVVAGVAGEAHQLGAHMVSDALEADGWHVSFLGADCSREDILRACRQCRPLLVALSCTMPGNLGEIERAITDLKAHAIGLRILVGGLAFGRGLASHALAQRLGADALAHDLSGAVAVARSWFEASRNTAQASTQPDGDEH